MAVVYHRNELHQPNDDLVFAHRWHRVVKCVDGSFEVLALHAVICIFVAPRTLAIDLVAVAELAVDDPELATLRWTHLRPKLGQV